MEAKLISLKCPNCHADVHIKDGSKIVYCEHCGAGLMLDDGVERKEETRNINITNKTYVNTVDEAKLRRAIDDGDLARRKFEEEAFEREQERKRKESQRAFAKKFFPITVLLFIASFVVQGMYEHTTYPMWAKIVLILGFVGFIAGMFLLGILLENSNK